MDKSLEPPRHDGEVLTPYALAPGCVAARQCLVRHIHADMRSRRFESRVNTMIAAMVVAVSAAALTWLYHTSLSQGPVSLAVPVQMRHEALEQGRRPSMAGTLVSHRRLAGRRASVLPSS